MNLPSAAPSLRQRLIHASVLLSIAASVLLGVFAPSVLQAGGQPKIKPRPPFLPPYDSINAVDATKGTITVGHVNSSDKSIKTYTLSRTCEIQVNGSKAAITDLKAGQKVSVNAGMDATVADRISVTPVPSAPPTPGAAGKPALGRQKGK